MLAQGNKNLAAHWEIISTGTCHWQAESDQGG